MKIEMKSNVKDNVSGFEGIVTARVEYDASPPRYRVTAQRLSDSSAIVEGWFDEGRLLIRPTALKIR